MKRLCIFLIKLDRGYFFLTVLLFALLVFSQVGSVDKMMPKIDGAFVFLVLFALSAVLIFTRRFFYPSEELNEQINNGNIVVYEPFVVSDKYFQIKINTALSFAQLLSGFIYVILNRLIVFIMAYILIVIFFGLVVKLWVGK
jgi:hypothetical protein